MTQDNTYNGWTNYATWRVNLEIFDGLDPSDMGWHRFDTYDLSQCLKEYVGENIIDLMPNGLGRDWADAFISDVNWYEIAKHKLEEYAEDMADA